LRLPRLPQEAVDFGLRLFRRFVEIEGAQQATVLAAQAFTSLIPFLVVGSAFGPGDEEVSERIIDRFDLDGGAARSVDALFNTSGEVASAVTWVSVVILILSALSFTRAMQRMFQRAYLHPPAGVRDTWRGLAWLAGFGAWISLSAPLRNSLEDLGGVVFTLCLTGASAFVLWLWTPAILLPDADWRRLVPGAAVSGVLNGFVTLGLAIYIPIAMTWSADRYGLIGVAFTLQTALLVVGFVAVLGAVAGAVTSEVYERTAP